MKVRIIEKMNLDSPSGHILVGLVLLYTMIACKIYGVDGGINELLAGLIGLALGQSLKMTNDGK